MPIRQRLFLAVLLLGIGGAGCSSSPSQDRLASETVNSQMMQGNMKVTTGTAEVDLNGGMEEVSFEEDDSLSNADPNADDETITVKSMMTGDQAVMGLDTAMHRMTFKSGGDTMTLQQQADLSFVLNGQPVKDLESIATSSNALSQTRPALLGLLAQRLDEGSFVTEKTCAATCDKSTFVAGIEALFLRIVDGGATPDYRHRQWVPLCRCLLPNTFTDRCAYDGDCGHAL